MDEFSKFFKKLMEFERYASRISRPSAIFLTAHEVFSEILDADRMIENESNTGLSGSATHQPNAETPENPGAPASTKGTPALAESAGGRVRRPCPFCLSDFLSEDTNSRNAFCVFCHQCHCVGPTAPTAELALEYWNNRGEADLKAMKERDFYLW